MLYTTEEFATYIGLATIDDLNVPRAELIRDLIASDIAELVGPVRYTATDPARFKSVAIEVAARSYANPEKFRSLQESIDDYSRMETYATETIAPPEFTAAEARRLRKAAGLRSAFTITPTSPPAEPRHFPPRTARPCDTTYPYGGG